MIAYLTTLTVVWAGGLAVYYALLARTRQHASSRAFLLAVGLGGLLVPALPVWGGGTDLLPAAGALPRTVWLPAATVVADVGTRIIPPEAWAALAAMAYLGAGAFAALDLRKLWALRRTRRPVRVAGLPPGLRLYETPLAGTPCSLGRAIYVERWRDLDPATRVALLRHEAEHARLRHSVDNGLLALCCVVLWWHPLAYGLRRALRLVHEFQADEAVLSVIHPPRYRQILLAQQIGATPSALLASFSHSPLKTRFAMMTRSKRSAPVRLVLASLALTLIGLACTKDSYEEEDLAALELLNTESAELPELSEIEFDDWDKRDAAFTVDTIEVYDPETQTVVERTLIGRLTDKATGDTQEFRLSDGTSEATSTERFRSQPVYTVVEQLPMFPGCPDVGDDDERQRCAQRKMLDFVYENISYPEVARAAGIEGTSVVSFIVGTDGEVLEQRVARLPGDVPPDSEAGRAFRRELLRLTAEMPAWIPGRLDGEDVQVRFNLPVRFELG